jgi:chromosomal replication initiation ATPase DnaA
MKNSKINLHQHLEIIAEGFDTTPSMLQSTSRAQYLVIARRTFVYVMKAIYGEDVNYPALTAVMNKTHSTYVYAKRNHLAHVRSNQDFRYHMQNVMPQILVELDMIITNVHDRARLQAARVKIMNDLN